MRRLPRNIVKFLRRPRRNAEWEKTLLEWIEMEEIEDRREIKFEYRIDEASMKIINDTKGQ